MRLRRVRPIAAPAGVDPYSTEAHCASETALPLGPRPCSDVPVAASNEQPALVIWPFL